MCHEQLLARSYARQPRFRTTPRRLANSYATYTTNQAAQRTGPKPHMLTTANRDSVILSGADSRSGTRMPQDAQGEPSHQKHWPTE
jgi:hypothetical protein